MPNATIHRIDKKLEELDPDSLRYRVLTALRQFRASWVELGRLLSDVAFGGDYKEWGYEDFEVYCARELGLKKPTVKKLMVSYNYMRSHEKNRLDHFEEDQPVSIPDYQTVELLHRARQQDELSDEEKENLHRRAFDGEEDETDLRKQIRTALRSGGGEDGEAIADANTRRKREMADILRTARNLRRKVAQSKAVPAGLRDRIEQVLVELEALD